MHAIHGRSGAALGSLGLRVGIPIAAAAVGAGVGTIAEGDCSGEWCDLGAALASLDSASECSSRSIVDIAGLAYEPDSNASTLRIALSPRVDPKRAPLE